MDNTDKLLLRLIKDSMEGKSAFTNVLILQIGEKTLSNLFTPARMELLRMIMEKHPASVGELAGLAGRSKESVSRDLRVLDNFGLLEFVTAGRTRKPTIGKDLIMIPLKAKP